MTGLSSDEMTEGGVVGDWSAKTFRNGSPLSILVAANTAWHKREHREEIGARLEVCRE